MAPVEVKENTFDFVSPRFMVMVTFLVLTVTPSGTGVGVAVELAVGALVGVVVDP